MKMVYYFTSGNIKMMRNILLDYNASQEVTPYEYMTQYMEQCPDSTEDIKLNWIAETFLGIEKHLDFLQDLASHLSEELSEEDRDYYVIVHHALTFQVAPKDMTMMYKALFNTSKPLTDTLTKFLSNNESLTFITEVAAAFYDISYITEKIINPLFMWQPYISEMAHNFAQYQAKVKYLKPITVPIQPNVLNRKYKPPPHAIPPTPDTHRKERKMLTKSVIDQRLKQISEKNKQLANELLASANAKNYHYAQNKSERYYKTISNIQEELEARDKLTKLHAKKFIAKPSFAPVKETVASVKRMNKVVNDIELKEIDWLNKLLKNCMNVSKLEEVEELDRCEREKNRTLDIEKKHLMGQLSYEEAVIAKQRIQEENKKKYEEFLNEKQSWDAELENWRKLEMEKHRELFEKSSLQQLSLAKSKSEVMLRNKESAERIKNETEILLFEALKEKQEEMERKINMIKEIKMLSILSKRTKIPKVIDLTQSSGFGFLCEMSIAELQERLSGLKVELKEEIEEKRNRIQYEKVTVKEELEQNKSSIKNFMTDRLKMRERNKKIKSINDLNARDFATKELNDLKKLLAEKRELRINLNR